MRNSIDRVFVLFPDDRVYVTYPEQFNHRYRHRNLGEVKVTLDCVRMQGLNPDSTTMFVEYEGEVIEISRDLITILVTPKSEEI
jgi:hypothetical protein